MAIVTSANLANAIVKLVAAEALPALMGNFVMGNLVNRDYEPMLANGGDTVNVPIPPVLVANNILDGGSVQPQAPNLGNAQIVLNTHAEATFTITDIVRALSSTDVLRAYMEPAMIAISAKVESDLLNLYSQFTQNTVLGTPATPITEAVIDNAETAMFNALVPPAAGKYLVVDGSTYGVIRSLPRAASFWNTGQQGIDALIQGEVVKFKDFFIFRSQYTPITSSGSPAVQTIHNLAFAKNAIGMAIRRLPLPLPGTGAVAEYAEIPGTNFGLRVTMSYQPNTLAQQFTVDVLYGVGVLRNGHAVQINC